MSFTDDGFAVVDNVLRPHRCKQFIGDLPETAGSGSRALLKIASFRQLAQDLRECDSLSGFLKDLVAVQCTYIRKTEGCNWSIKMHRDRVVPIEGSGSWPPSGVKE